MRTLLRAPIAMYRWRLGWLLGERFLLLTHTGRRSGQARQTVLEVVDHDQATDRYVVASGWGRGSDWFQNIQHQPAVRVGVGRRSFPAAARILPTEEAAQALATYARRHPMAFRWLVRAIFGRTAAGHGLQVAQMASLLPLVALERKEQSAAAPGLAGR